MLEFNIILESLQKGNRIEIKKILQVTIAPIRLIKQCEQANAGVEHDI